MNILIVDSSEASRTLIASMLKDAGYVQITEAPTYQKAYTILNLSRSSESEPDFDLIIINPVMPHMDGIEAVQRIKTAKHLVDIPILITASQDPAGNMERVLNEGLIDFIRQPIDEVELRPRIRSLMKLKEEMDLRKAREVELRRLSQQYAEVHEKLEQITNIDALTGIANRRCFNRYFENSWLLAVREYTSICLLMIDIDCFTAFNDLYGREQGDECLTEIAETLEKSIRRPGDFLARYSGGQFAAVLGNTDVDGAIYVAESMRTYVQNEAIKHTGSRNGDYLTISVGLAGTVPAPAFDADSLVAAAEEALDEAKTQGGDRVIVGSVDSGLVQ